MPLTEAEFAAAEAAGMRPRDWHLSDAADQDFVATEPSRTIEIAGVNKWSLFQRGHTLVLTLPQPIRMLTTKGPTGVSNAHEMRPDDPYWGPPSAAVEGVWAYHGMETADGQILIDHVTMEFAKDKLTVELGPSRGTTYEHTLAVFMRLVASMEPNHRDQLKGDIMEMATRYMGVQWGRFSDKMNIRHVVTYLSFPILKESGSIAAARNLISPRTHHDELSLSLLSRMPRLSFAQLFKEYVGSKSPTLIKIVGQKFMVGHEYCRLEMTQDQEIQQKVRKMHQNNTLEEGENHIIMTGDKTVVPQLLWYTKLLLDLMPVDRARRVLEAMDSRSIMVVRVMHQSCTGAGSRQDNLEMLLGFLGRFSGKTLEDLLISIDSGTYIDCERQLREFATPDSIPNVLKHAYPEGLKMPRNWKTFKELHDKISKAYNEIKAEANNKKIEYPEGFPHLKLDGLVMSQEGAPDLVMKLAKETKDLVEWGRILKICIASYADQAVSGSCVLVGIYRGGEIIYAMELPPKPESVGEVESTNNVFGIRFKTGIRQLVQEHNRPVEGVDLSLIVGTVNKWAKECQ